MDELVIAYSAIEGKLELNVKKYLVQKQKKDSFFEYRLKNSQRLRYWSKSEVRIDCNQERSE